MIPEDQAKKLMKQLSPDQLGVAKTLTLNKIELEHLRKAVAELQTQHDDLFKVMILILHMHGELRIHETQFLRFKEEYRIDREYDKETREVVLRLKTLMDK